MAASIYFYHKAGLVYLFMGFTRCEEGEFVQGSLDPSLAGLHITCLDHSKLLRFGRMN